MSTTRANYSNSYFVTIKKPHQNAKLGLTFGKFRDDSLRILCIKEGSLTSETAIQVGDYCVSINGTSLHSGSHNGAHAAAALIKEAPEMVTIVAIRSPEYLATAKAFSGWPLQFVPAVETSGRKQLCCKIMPDPLQYAGISRNVGCLLRFNDNGFVDRGAMNTGDDTRFRHLGISDIVSSLVPQIAFVLYAFYGDVNNVNIFRSNPDVVAPHVIVPHVIAPMNSAPFRVLDNAPKTSNDFFYA